MRWIAIMAASAAAAGLLAACGRPGASEASAPAPAAAPAQAAAAAAPAGPTEDMAKAAIAFMEGTMQPTADEVWNSVGFIIDENGEHDLSPKNDEEWKAVEGKADRLVAVVQGLKNASFRWDPATWTGFCDEVIAAVEANKRAAQAKDVEAMYTAGEELDRACESCHVHWEEGETGAAQTPPA